MQINALIFVQILCKYTPKEHQPQYHIRMTKKLLRKLKESLPAGYAQSIAKATGYSPDYCTNVLNGFRNNDIIIAAAVDLAERTRDERLALANKIKSL